MWFCRDLELKITFPVQWKIPRKQASVNEPETPDELCILSWGEGPLGAMWGEWNLRKIQLETFHLLLVSRTSQPQRLETCNYPLAQLIWFSCVHQPLKLDKKSSWNHLRQWNKEDLGMLHLAPEILSNWKCCGTAISWVWAEVPAK